MADGLGLGHVIGAVLVIAIGAVNVFGMRPAVWLSYLTGGLLLIPVAVFVIVPYLSGEWRTANLAGGPGEGAGTWEEWRLALVWLYVMGWSSYGVETCATFAPEYRDTVRDTSRALRSSALFSLAVYALLPLGVAGTTGRQAAADPLTFYVPAFERLVGGASGVMVTLILASLLLSMNVALADGSRALYGIARDRMTVRESRG